MSELDPLIIGAVVTLDFGMATPINGYYFSFGKYDPETDTDGYGVPDWQIEQYVEGMGALEDLKHLDANDEERDWVIVSIDEPIYERSTHEK